MGIELLDFVAEEVAGEYEAAEESGEQAYAEERAVLVGLVGAFTVVGFGWVLGGEVV